MKEDGFTDMGVGTYVLQGSVKKARAHLFQGTWLGEAMTVGCAPVWKEEGLNHKVREG